MTLLSVHLITYNNENHIDDALKSILKQKVNFVYEIVVSDDCSTDKTLDIVNSYATKHPLLFKVHQNKTQLGILKNFKATLDRCAGKYIFDIAGDDMLKTNDAFQKITDIFENNPDISFIDSGFDRLCDHNKLVTPFINAKKIKTSKNNYIELILLGEVAPIGHCYKKEALYKYVDFDTYINMELTIEDYPILVDLAMNTNFERINEVLHIYRVHDESHSHKKDFNEMVFQKNQIKTLFDYFSKKYSFSEKLQQNFTNKHHKTLLFLAGYFSNKALGKEMYRKIRTKTAKDRIHFLASQFKAIRNLVTMRKKLPFLS